jgi:hypothetical protein
MKLGEPHKKQIKINYKAQFITYSMLNDEKKNKKAHKKPPKSTKQTRDLSHETRIIS